MIISLRKWIRFSKFLLFFILASLLLYQLITWLVPWVYPDLNKTPDDGAIKVFSYIDHVMHKEEGLMDHVKHRLLLYYWLDE